MRVRLSGFGGLAVLSLALPLAVGCGGGSSPQSAGTGSSSSPHASASTPAQITPDVDVALKSGDAPQNPYVAYGSLWVAGHHTQEVLRLDLTTGKVLARINTGAVEPGGIAAGAGLVWVTHYGTGRLLVGIDPKSNTIVRRTKLPDESCCQPAVLGSTVWVAAGSPDAHAIVGVDARTGRVVGRLPGLDGPVVVNGQLWASRDGDTVIVNPRDGNVTTTAALGTVLWDSPTIAGLAWGMQDGAAVGMTSDGTVARTVIAPDGLKLSYTEGMAVTSGQTVWAVSEISLWRIDSGAKTAVLAAKLNRDIHSITGDGKGGVWVALFDKSRMQHFPA